ncbi:MAG TPA: SAM-dependent methyltransferase [Candidatus Synoicihabitans sp.]|nr:SAM-dependent methyltransferase [Candidatus Synoicihabitans sp.]
MSQPLPARDRFLQALRSAVGDGTLTKLTLGKYRGSDATLKNVFVRPVALKSGPHLSFVWRHETRDVTKNHAPAEALALLESHIGRDFLDAHLFTPMQTAQLETSTDGHTRVSIKFAKVAPPPPPPTHDRVKQRVLAADSGWLRDLGVTNEQGQPRAGLAPKLRQIQKFAELLQHLLAEIGWADDRRLHVVDMGSGKGYLTFAVATVLGARATVHGIERRSELVETCNRIAAAHGLPHLSFRAGEIDATAAAPIDLLIALHACDTATDDALAAGVRADAGLLIVSPCCQKELHDQLTAPPVLAPALRHGIFHERQAEFVTDAMRALALEAAGYRTKVFEFVSTEHTAKNLMLAAIRTDQGPDPVARRQLAELASLYGIREQRLAKHLNLSLAVE